MDQPPSLSALSALSQKVSDPTWSRIVVNQRVIAKSLPSKPDLRKPEKKAYTTVASDG